MNTPRKIKIETLEKILNRKCCTIKLYLDRAEFSHISTFKDKAGKWFTNITANDIENLKNLLANRIKRK